MRPSLLHRLNALPSLVFRSPPLSPSSSLFTPRGPSRAFAGRARAEPKKRDYYEVLGVDRNVSKVQLKKAYFQLAQQCHPDKNPSDPRASEKFAEISHAYEVLSDDQRRSTYDQFGHEAEDQGLGGGPGFTASEELFEQLFGGGMGPFSFFEDEPQRKRKPKAADIQYNLKISFQDMVKGCTKTITIDSDVSCEPCSGSGHKKGAQSTVCRKCKGTGHTMRTEAIFQFQIPCDKCEGTGAKKADCPPCNGKGVVRAQREVSVKIPAGVEDGAKVRMRGHGHAGPVGVTKGSLVVNVEVEEDPVFTRDGSNLHTDVPISLPTAILGGTVSVPSLSGEFTLDVQPGTQPDEEVMMKGKGLTVGTTKGNQVIHFKVEIPKTLTEEQRGLMEAFAKTDPKYAKPKT